jgi:hypothetical protein
MRKTPRNELATPMRGLQVTRVIVATKHEYEKQRQDLQKPALRLPGH